MNKPLEKYQHLYVTLQEFFKTGVEIIEYEHKEMPTYSMEDLADIAYAMRTIDKLLDKLGVSLRKHKAKAEALCCSKYIAFEEDEPIRTEYCSATPDVKEGISIPPRDSVEYAELVQHLNLPLSDMYRLHWPTLTEYIAKRDAEGLPPLPGLNVENAKSIFRLTIREKKGLLDDFKRTE